MLSMPASKLVLKMLCSTDCLQHLLSRNSRSGLNHRKMEAEMESLMTNFAVPHCQSRSRESSHGHPSAQWLPDRSMVNEASLRSSWEIKSAGPGWDQQDTGPSTVSPQCRLGRNQGKVLSVNEAPKTRGTKGTQQGGKTMSDLTFNTNK